MSSTEPWWSTPVFTLAGVLITLLVTVWLDHRRGHRESRHRWTERKMDLYSEFLAACDALQDVEVWPPDRDTEPTPTKAPFTQARQAARCAAYVAPDEVRTRLHEAMTAAQTFAALIDNVRATTKRGHTGAVDDRVRSQLADTREAFDTAVEMFVTATRKDIDIGERIS